MLRMSQFMRLLAALGLVCALAATSNARTAAPSGAAAQSKAKASGKAKASKARAPKASANDSSKAKDVAAVKESAEGNAIAHRRDPFRSLLSNQQSGAAIPVNLPPGKAGLMISTLRVDGIVRGPNGMLVVVTNAQSRTYFLRQGDRLYDGVVEQISMDGVSFKEMGKDPFGKPIERVVTKRIFPSAGEQ